jgi:hypothetical protein
MEREELNETQITLNGITQTPLSRKPAIFLSKSFTAPFV